MHNLYQQFRSLLPDPPLQVGAVIATNGGVKLAYCNCPDICFVHNEDAAE